MLDLRDLEEKDKNKEKKQKERIFRQNFVKFLESEIKEDQITAKTSFSEYFTKLINQECYYNLLGQELCTPRDLFFDFREKLTENQKNLKRIFIGILKKNLDDFCLEVKQTEFHDKLFTFVEFKEFVKRELVNSTTKISSYLMEKLVKKQKKAVRKLLKYFYENDVSENVGFGDVLTKLKEFENGICVSSLPENDIKRFFEMFQNPQNDKEKMIEFLLDKYCSKRRRENVEGSCSVALEENVSKNKEFESDQVLEKRSDDREEGEIKDINFSLGKSKKIKYN